MHKQQTLPMIQNKTKLGDSVMKEKCINTAPVHAAKDPLLISTNQKQELPTNSDESRIQRRILVMMQEKSADIKENLYCYVVSFSKRPLTNKNSTDNSQLSRPGALKMQEDP